MQNILNPYAITSKYLTNLFEQNKLVNTVIFGTADQTDLNKTNIFPLAHIMPGQVQLVENRFQFQFDIAVVNMRQIKKKPQTDKIFGDNLIDNLNESFAILAKELTTLDLQQNEFDILLESSTAAQPIIFADKNLLDGFEVTIVLSIQNEIPTCE